MGKVSRYGAVVVILSNDDIGAVGLAEVADLLYDSPENLVVHPRCVDRVVSPRSIGVTGGVGLFRPEDRQIWLLVRQDVIDEHIREVTKSLSRKRSAAIERVGGLPVVQPLNSNWSSRIAVVVRERKRARFVGVHRVLWKG